MDERNEKIGRKIRDNEMKRIPYMLVGGEKEAENKEVAVRKQGEGDKGTMKLDVYKRQEYKLNGFALGVTYNPSFHPQLRMIAEYDSKDYALGATYLL